MKKPPDIIYPKVERYFEGVPTNDKIIDYYKNLSIDDFFNFNQEVDSNVRYYFIIVNNQLKQIFKHLLKHKILNEVGLTPSFIKNIQKIGKYKPFWNENIQKLSDKLFMPSVDNLFIKSTDCFKSLNGTWFDYVYETGYTNDYHINFQKEPINKKPVTRARQIKLFLTNQQKTGLNRIIGGYRYFYNRTIQYTNNLNYKKRTSYFYVDYSDETTKIELNIPDKLNLLSMKQMRSYLKTNKPNWLLKDYPSHLIDKAIEEALKNVKANIDKVKNKEGYFNMNFKTKKDIYQSINLDSTMIIGDKNGIFVTLKLDEEGTTLENLNTSQKIKDFDFGGSTITYHTVLGTYILNLTYTKKKKCAPRKDEMIAGLDPGEVNFLGLYCEQFVMKLGNEARKKIEKICKEIDIIQSIMNKAFYYVKNKKGDIIKIHIMTSERKRRLRKAMHRKIQKIKNMVTEMHNKIANFLTLNFTKIVIPPFETQKMVSTLNSKVSRSMNTLSHYKFRQRLISKCEERNVDLIIRDEAYTSKTCTGCGSLDTTFNKRICKCKKCGLEIDRDYSAPRNFNIKTVIINENLN